MILRETCLHDFEPERTWRSTPARAASTVNSLDAGLGRSKIHGFSPVRTRGTTFALEESAGVDAIPRLLSCLIDFSVGSPTTSASISAPPTPSFTSKTRASSCANLPSSRCKPAPQSAGRRRRSQAHARPHPGQYRRRAPAEGRRHRRFRGDRGDAAPLHHEGAQQPRARPSAGRHRRALGHYRSGKTRRARIRHSRRRARSLSDRRTDGGGDRRRSSGAGSGRQHDHRHRRRHHRSGDHFALRHRLQPQRARGGRRARRSIINT